MILQLQWEHAIIMLEIVEALPLGTPQFGMVARVGATGKPARAGHTSSVSRQTCVLTMCSVDGLRGPRFCKQKHEQDKG